MGAGSGGMPTAGRGGTAGQAGTSGVSGEAGAGGSPDGGQAGEAGAGGEGGGTAGEGGTAGSGGMAGVGGIGGGAGVVAAGTGGAGAGAGGAGAGGTGPGGAGPGGAGTGGAVGGGGSGGKGIPGLDVPCQNGPGWALFRFHYPGSGGTAPAIDVWDATCSYSQSASSTCVAHAVQSTSLVHSNTAILIDGSNELQVRFSVQGLSFTGAAVYVRARSYSTNASTRIRAASVLHGEGLMGPVDQDFTFDWYGMDWSTNLLPTDAPLGTALRVYAYQGSGALAIMSVEVCLR